MITNDLVIAIAEHALGTCMSEVSLFGNFPDEDGEDYSFDDFNDDQYGIFDDITMLCTNCNWWCETSEMEVIDGEVLCQDCQREIRVEEDEDD